MPVAVDVIVVGVKRDDSAGVDGEFVRPVLPRDLSFGESKSDLFDPDD